MVGAMFQGLVESKKSLHLDGCKHKEPSLDEQINVPLASPLENGYRCQTITSDDICPVCQEKLQSQRMVFQCGHVTCCKCRFLLNYLPKRKKEKNRTSNFLIQSMHKASA